ncbi:BlaI/MecI/CopY family transcriptional regulator [Acetivibrio cellulolyticus]|uniref:BlaI/MecI/CopY family transcriptional regulator n=1 Tax=Acetivibrio cellulolyticus TaxID=35830 RepID=UPI0001E304C4|nr:BlaI/MecI/CopY family transcriptional regulator [Acetivibrio cellulolyticus]
MDNLKLFDSELKLMEIIWENEPVCAKQLGLLANDLIGWNKNTTYTIIKKLIEKAVIRRDEPNFMCSSLIKKKDVQKAETKSLIDKLYSGSKKAFFASFLQREDLSEQELAEIKEMIDKR